MAPVSPMHNISYFRLGLDVSHPSISCQVITYSFTLLHVDLSLNFHSQIYFLQSAAHAHPLPTLPTQHMDPHTLLIRAPKSTPTHSTPPRINTYHATTPPPNINQISPGQTKIRLILFML